MSNLENNENPEIHEFVVEEVYLGGRVDVFLAQQVDGLSRSRATELIRADCVQVNGRKPKGSARLKTGDQVSIVMKKFKPDLPVAENIPLDIIFEDDSFVAVNKPAGMVVHPAKGHWQGTLTAGLIFHFQNLSSRGGAQRPGIVHRLDRDTSGVILIAKTDEAHQALTGQFEARTVKKTYLAVVSPPPDRDRDEIDQPIGVHAYQREKMAIRANHKTSRNAMTFFEVQSRHGRHAIVHAFPKTGRTHQIRVHLAHIGSPVLCDKLYSGRASISREALIDSRHSATKESNSVLERQALHALKIEFDHPTTGDRMELAATIPPDLQTTIEIIRS